jgi:acetyl-CoA acetyltransferase
MSGLRNATAIVGVGETPLYKRGASYPQTRYELAGRAILNAAEDAGLAVEEIDGFSFYSNSGSHGSPPLEAAVLAQMLGIPRIRFAITISGGGGGSAAAVATAAAAIHAGMANAVVTVMARQITARRPGEAFSERPESHWDFVRPAGLVAPGQMFALIAQRHMHLYGTTRESFAEVAISSRANASRLESSMLRSPLTRVEYFQARMISSPLCLFDYCLENDGAAACITTSAGRARDLRQPPALIRASAQGGDGAWGQGEEWLQMPDDCFATAGYESLAEELLQRSDLAPSDIDVAELYDHFTAMVLLQLEDFGFCPRGESGDFVSDGHIRWPGGALPVNTHGGSLSNGNLNGMTHVNEAVRQVRGTAVNQVADAKTALVSGGPGRLPLSALILRSEQ